MSSMVRFVPAFLSLGFLVAAAPAAAQTIDTERVFLDINACVQEGNSRFAVETALPAFGREGSLTVDDEFTGGGLFDVSGMVRVRGSFAVGAGYFRTSSREFLPFVAVVPSPIGTNLPATINGVTPGLRNREQAVYLKAAWVRAPTERFVYALSAGPAFFRVRQDVPFTSAALSGGILTTMALTTETFSESAVGFHAGVDLNYMVARRVGAGVLMRYTRGSVEFPDSTAPMTVGGVQIGVGLRARF